MAVTMKKSLSQFSAGEYGRVISVTLDAAMQQRLLDLGITENTLIKCLFKSPFGDPCAYLVKGTVIALRQEDSCNILCTTKN